MILWRLHFDWLNLVVSRITFILEKIKEKKIETDIFFKGDFYLYTVCANTGHVTVLSSHDLNFAISQL